MKKIIFLGLLLVSTSVFGSPRLNQLLQGTWMTSIEDDNVFIRFTLDERTHKGVGVVMFVPIGKVLPEVFIYFSYDISDGVLYMQFLEEHTWVDGESKFVATRNERFYEYVNIQYSKEHDEYYWGFQDNIYIRIELPF